MSQDQSKDLERYLLSPAGKPASKPLTTSSNRTVKNRFIRGPILWRWWAQAARLRGKTLHVASTIWLLAGLNRTTRNIRLSGKILRELGVKRSSAYRAIAALERAGLITVDRRPGRSPIVSLVGVPENIFTQAGSRALFAHPPGRHVGANAMDETPATPLQSDPQFFDKMANSATDPPAQRSDDE